MHTIFGNVSKNNQISSYMTYKFGTEQARRGSYRAAELISLSNLQNGRYPQILSNRPQTSIRRRYYTDFLLCLLDILEVITKNRPFVFLYINVRSNPHPHPCILKTASLLTGGYEMCLSPPYIGGVKF